ncbi:hypothetical protein OR571_16700 [Psychrobacillus sp. NEAU-3TGS]|uniref:hypothetical protein n=1 Tax=Psychrobacillus sp. NEAU-3TGS TaxID=2995412 RepID=UPI002497E20D|nr:hypothetical protein [Psychrobacillus sp. NEAU-3TGS]MDI2588697.1 hypothetical protein [Psychrobacillus sp. NEAU-3TGS]
MRRVEEQGAYRIRPTNGSFNQSPDKHQLMQAKRYNIEVTNQTKKELQEIIKEYESK